MNWVASWLENGKRKGRMFSIAKYGNSEALSLAISVREQAVLNLIEAGIDISERHGK